MVDNVVIDVKAKSMSRSGGEDPNTNVPRKHARPPYSRFTQQELPACKPILTPGLIIASFTLIAVVFIPIGLASLFASQSVVEILDRYDADCIPPGFKDQAVSFIQSSSTSKSCIRRLIVPKQMKSPIFIYYQLDNFYQNHRRYVKSRNDKQMLDGTYESTAGDCSPEVYADDNKTEAILPCGLVAWSLFNDTYSFYVNRSSVKVNRKNITWESDRIHRFGSNVYPKNFQSGPIVGGGRLDPELPLSQQEDLMVWMRAAALPTFRKLYGKIEEDLQENDVVEVELENNYNSYMFKGKKTLVLSNASWAGGKNDFVGYAYIVVGALNLALAFCFAGIHLLRPRIPGDTSYLSWNINPDLLKS